MSDFITPNAYWNELIRNEDNLNINIFIPDNYNNKIYFYTDWTLLSFTFLLVDLSNNIEYPITNAKNSINPNSNFKLIAIYDGSELNYKQPNVELPFNLYFEFIENNIIKKQNIEWKQIINIKPKLSKKIEYKNCEDKSYDLLLEYKGFNLPINIKILNINNEINKFELNNEINYDDYFYKTNIKNDLIKVIVYDNINKLEDIIEVDFSKCFDFNLLPLIKKSSCDKIYHTSCNNCKDGIILFETLYNIPKEIIWKKIINENEIILIENIIQQNDINRGLKRGSLINVDSGLYECIATNNDNLTIIKKIEVKAPQNKEVIIKKINDILLNNDGMFSISLQGFEPQAVILIEPNVIGELNGNEWIYSNLKSGIYTIKVKDCLNHIYENKIEILDKSNFIFNLLYKEDVCNDKLGKIRFNIEWDNYPIMIEIISDNPNWIKQNMYIYENNEIELNNLLKGKYQLNFILNEKRIENKEFIIYEPIKNEFKYYIGNEKIKNDGELKVYHSFSSERWKTSRELNFNLIGVYNIPYERYFEKDNWISFNFIQISDFHFYVKLNNNLIIDINYYNLLDEQDLINRLNNDFNNDIYNFKNIDNINYLYFDGEFIFSDILYDNNYINLIDIGKIEKIICNSIIKDGEKWSGLCPGYYRLEITTNDVCNFYEYKDFYIQSIPELDLEYTTIDESKWNSKDGRIYPNGLNGCSEYIYNLYQNNILIQKEKNIFDNLSEGLYELEVIDICGNKLKKDVQINGKEPLIVNLYNWTSLITYNKCEGEIELELISPQNINNSSPYNFNWNSNNRYNLQSSYLDGNKHKISNLCKGIYNVNINDVWGNTYEIKNIMIDEELNPCLDDNNKKLDIEFIDFPSELYLNENNIISLKFNINANNCCLENNQLWIVEIKSNNFIFYNSNFTETQYNIDTEINNWNIPIQLKDNNIGNNILNITIYGCLIKNYELSYLLYEKVNNVLINPIKVSDNILKVEYIIPPLEEYQIAKPEFNIIWSSEDEPNEIISLPYIPDTENSIEIEIPEDKDIIISINDEPSNIVVPTKKCPVLKFINFNEIDFILNWDYNFITDEYYNYQKIKIQINNDEIILDIINNILPNEYKIEFKNINYNIKVYSICENGVENKEGEWIWSPNDQIQKSCLSPNIINYERNENGIYLKWELVNYNIDYHLPINNWILLYKRVNLDQDYFKVNIAFSLNEYLLEGVDNSLSYYINIISDCLDVPINSDVFIENILDDCPNIEEVNIVKDDNIIIQWKVERYKLINEIKIRTYIGDELSDEIIVDYDYENQINEYILENIDSSIDYRVTIQAICNGCNQSCELETKIPKDEKECPIIDIWEIKTINNIIKLIWEVREFEDNEFRIDYFNIIDENETILYEKIDYKLKEFIIDKNFNSIKLRSYCDCDEKMNDTDFQELQLECKEVIWVLNKKLSNIVKLNWFISNKENTADLEKIIILWNEEGSDVIYRLEIEDLSIKETEIEVASTLNYVFELKSICNSEENSHGIKNLTNECNNQCDKLNTWNWLREKDYLKINWIKEERLKEIIIQLKQDNIIEYKYDINLEMVEIPLDVNKNYEFRIAVLCNNNSKSCFSSYINLPKIECKSPYDFIADNITDVSLLLKWKYDGILIPKFSLLYNNIIIEDGFNYDGINYFINIDGLEADTTYEFILSTKCDELKANNITLTIKTNKLCNDLLDYNIKEINNNLLIKWNINPMKIKIVDGVIVKEERLFNLENEWIFNNFEEKEYKIYFIYDCNGTEYEKEIIYNYNKNNCNEITDVDIIEKTNNSIIINWFRSGNKTKLILYKDNIIIEEVETMDYYYNFCNLVIGDYILELINNCDFGVSNSIYFNFNI